jgi:glycosyltransferase involved in cell wall biosynthesis
MIQIAFFAPFLMTGGTQRHLQQVLRLLDRRRFGARVFTLRAGGEVERELQADGIPVTPLGIGRGLATPSSVRAVLRAAHALRAEGIDVVHGYQWRPALVGVVAARLAGVPVAVASKRSLTGDDRWARLAWRVIGRRADVLLTNADALRTEAEAHGTVARWEVIPNGVDTDWFRVDGSSAEAKRALGLHPVRPVLGAVGRLEARKGHDLLLDALHVMRTLAPAHRPQLLLVGDGPLRSALERRTGELGLARDVMFAGSLSDVRPALAAIDLFVLPSRAEGMSNALLEAMAAARPVVATAVGGTSEVLDADRTGVLVRPDDPEALAAAVLGLLAEPVRCARLGAAARQAVEDRFGARRMISRLEELYTERLAARERPAA